MLLVGFMNNFCTYYVLVYFIQIYHKHFRKVPVVFLHVRGRVFRDFCALD